MKWILAITSWIALCLSQSVSAREQSGWVVNGKTLHPDCFVTEWMSSDNFEVYEERFKIEDIERFRQFPGEFFGREIKEFGSLQIEGQFVTHTSVSVVKPLGSCIPESFNFSAEDNRIYVVEDFGSWKLEQFYKLVAQITPVHCASLASNLEMPCVEAYEVEVGTFSGGSMGWDIRNGTYGLFDLPDLGLAVVPLRYK